MILKARADIGGRRHVVDDGVEQRLDALVLEGGAGKHRHEGVAQGTLADALLEVLDRGLLALKVGHHDVVVLLDHHLEQLAAPLLRLLEVVSGDVGHVELGAE